jgi:hypothetical protein
MNRASLHARKCLIECWATSPSSHLIFCWLSATRKSDHGARMLTGAAASYPMFSNGVLLVRSLMRRMIKGQRRSRNEAGSARSWSSPSSGLSRVTVASGVVELRTDGHDHRRAAVGRRSAAPPSTDLHGDHGGPRQLKIQVAASSPVPLAPGLAGATRGITSTATRARSAPAADTRDDALSEAGRRCRSASGSPTACHVTAATQ